MKKPKYDSGTLQLFINSVQDYGIFLLDTQGNVMTWNAGAQRLKGYTADEIIGHHFSEFYPFEDIAAGKPAHELEVASKTGRFEDFGWRLRKDGTAFFANVVITAVRDDSGNLIGFGKVTRDLTERQVAEERLRQSEEIFRLLVESVKDYGIFMLDPQGKIMTWNRGAQRIKGYQADEIIGTHFSKFYPREDVAAGKPEMELVVAAREGRFEDLGWRIRKDGTRFWANVIITAVKDAEGNLRGFAKVTRDLSDQKLVEEERNMRVAAQAANEAKSRFLSSMSHELRTPLNSIIGYVGIILMGLSGPLSADQQRQLEEVDRSARHLLALINDILNLSKVEAGEANLQIEKFDCKPLLQQVHSSLKIQADAKKLDFELNLGEDLVVLADARATKQVILNVVANAIKFTKRGRIELNATRQGHSVYISVVDTGIGIDKHDQIHLFQPFGQLDSEMRHQGTGLGLYLSKALLDQMGGSIAVESRVNEGSKFTVTLPAAE